MLQRQLRNINPTSSGIGRQINKGNNPDPFDPTGKLHIFKASLVTAECQTHDLRVLVPGDAVTLLPRWETAPRLQLRAKAEVKMKPAGNELTSPILQGKDFLG